MIRTSILEAAVWSAVVVTVVGSGLAWHRAASFSSPVDPPVVTAPGPPENHQADALREAAAVVVEENPFRLDRRPADVRFGLDADAARPPRQLKPEPPPPRPDLALAGVIGGPSWQAVLEGVPGQRAGRLVRAGDRLGELRVLSVRPDTTVVAGSDTTWVLTLKRPWK